MKPSLIHTWVGVGFSSGKKMSRLRKREGKGIGLRRLSSRVEAILRGMVKVNYGGKMA